MKEDYIKHHQKMNGEKNHLKAYCGAKSYYDAELPQILKYVDKDLPVVEIRFRFWVFGKISNRIWL